MRDLSTNFVTKQHSLYVHDLDSYCLGEHDCMRKPFKISKINERRRNKKFWKWYNFMTKCMLIEQLGKANYLEWNW